MAGNLQNQRTLVERIRQLRRASKQKIYTYSEINQLDVFLAIYPDIFKAIIQHCDVVQATNFLLLNQALSNQLLQSEAVRKALHHHFPRQFPKVPRAIKLNEFLIYNDIDSVFKDIKKSELSLTDRRFADLYINHYVPNELLGNYITYDILKYILNSHLPGERKFGVLSYFYEFATNHTQANFLIFSRAHFFKLLRESNNCIPLSYLGYCRLEASARFLLRYYFRDSLAILRGDKGSRHLKHLELPILATNFQFYIMLESFLRNDHKALLNALSPKPRKNILEKHSRAIRKREVLLTLCSLAFVLIVSLPLSIAMIVALLYLFLPFFPRKIKGAAFSSTIASANFELVCFFCERFVANIKKMFKPFRKPDYYMATTVSNYALNTYHGANHFLNAELYSEAKNYFMKYYADKGGEWFERVIANRMELSFWCGYIEALLNLFVYPTRKLVTLLIGATDPAGKSMAVLQKYAAFRGLDSHPNSILKSVFFHHRSRALLSPEHPDYQATKALIEHHPKEVACVEKYAYRFSSPL